MSDEGAAVAEPEIKVDPAPLAGGETPTETPSGSDAPTSDDKPQADATGDEPKGEEKPEASDDKPPDPTPFEKLVAETTDPEAKVAMIQRAMDGLSDEERATLPALQAKLDAAKGDQAQTQMREAEATRQAGLRQAESDVASGQSKINAHLVDVLDRIKNPAADTPDAELAKIAFDPGILNPAIEELVRGEVVLRDSGYKKLVAGALMERIHELGEPLTDDEFREMAKWSDSDEGKSRHQMVGAYFDKLVTRADARGFERGKAEGAEAMERFKKSELSAHLAEQMREQGLEPDTSGTKPATSGTLLKDMSADERAALSPAEIDAKMADEFSAA